MLSSEAILGAIWNEELYLELGIARQFENTCGGGVQQGCIRHHNCI
jgi:hypothetical protein